MFFSSKSTLIYTCIMVNAKREGEKGSEEKKKKKKKKNEEEL